MTRWQKLLLFLHHVRVWIHPPAPCAPMAIPLPAVTPACTWCREPLLAGESRHPWMKDTHVECALRAICGPIAHLEKRCSCYVDGSTENDPPGLSKRDAALLVFRKMRETSFGPPN